jgi:hypothetical protein
VAAIDVVRQLCAASQQAGLVATAPWRSTHQADADAPDNLARYSTGSFTTVQSLEQDESTRALSRSRSQERTH